MKIAFVVSSLRLSGGVQMISQYANLLTERGHECVIIAPAFSADQDVLDNLTSGVTVVYTPAWVTVRKNPVANATLALALSFSVPTVDFVIATHTPTTLVTLVACHLLRKGRPIWLFADYAEMFSGRKIESWLLRNALRWHVAALAISDGTLHELASYAPGRVEYVGLGLSRPEWLFPSDNRTEASEPFNVLYLGDMRPRKGLADFLCACELLAKQGVKLHLWVASKEECVVSTSLPYTFFFRPNDQQLTDLYRSCDVFVSSSWKEGFGLPPLEAMACGAPVVTTDSGGINQFAKHDENCLIVPIKNPKVLSIAMHKILVEPALAERLSSAGLRTASQHSWRAAVNRFEEVLSVV